MTGRLLAAALLAAAFAVRAEPVLDDFAYAFEIETGRPAALYSLALPQAVYIRSLTADQSDLAVFNAAGETVPYALQDPPLEAQTRPAPVELPHFPLYENATELPKQLTVELLADFQRATVELEKQPPPKDSPVIAYIVDTGAREQQPGPGIDALLIDWSNSGESFLARIDIEASADLAHWYPIKYQAALARLTYVGNQLEQNRVELGLRPERYLRIQWPAGRTGARIDRVRALFAPVRRPAERRWRHFAGHFNDDEAHPAIEYEIPGHLPIAEVNLALGNVNNLLPALIESRDSSEETWKLQRRGLFYRVQLGEAELTNPDFAIARTTDRFWRVTYDPQQANLGGKQPWLRVGWVPRRLIFLARGNEPFTLAYGSARVHSQQAPLDAMLNELNQAARRLPMGAAQTGRVVRAGGAEALIPPSQPLEWRNWLLWSSLVFGVLVLAFLAVRLYRQVNGTPR